MSEPTRFWMARYEGGETMASLLDEYEQSLAAAQQERDIARTALTRAAKRWKAAITHAREALKALQREMVDAFELELGNRVPGNCVEVHDWTDVRHDFLFAEDFPNIYLAAREATQHGGA